MMRTREALNWMHGLPLDGGVAVDEGGLTLVGLHYDGNTMDAYLEIGGVPKDAGEARPDTPDDKHELDQRLKEGERGAQHMVSHLMGMGAANCTIPVTRGGMKFEVVVRHIKDGEDDGGCQ